MQRQNIAKLLLCHSASKSENSQVQKKKSKKNATGKELQGGYVCIPTGVPSAVHTRVSRACEFLKNLPSWSAVEEAVPSVAYLYSLLEPKGGRPHTSIRCHLNTGFCVRKMCACVCVCVANKNNDVLILLQTIPLKWEPHGTEGSLSRCPQCSKYLQRKSLFCCLTWYCYGTAWRRWAILPTPFT